MVDDNDDEQERSLDKNSERFALVLVKNKHANTFRNERVTGSDGRSDARLLTSSETNSKWTLDGKEPVAWFTTSSGAHVPMYEGDTKASAADRKFGAGHKEKISKKAPVPHTIKLSPGTIHSDDPGLIDEVNQRNAELAKNSRGAKILNDIMTDKGNNGTAIVFSEGDDRTLILMRGEEIDSEGQSFVGGKVNSCHWNTARLYQIGAVDTIVTGYAVTNDDGLWRAHTWGLKDGKVVETTVPRDKYYGVRLTESESQEFMKGNDPMNSVNMNPAYKFTPEDVRTGQKKGTLGKTAEKVSTTSDLSEALKRRGL